MPKRAITQLFLDRITPPRGDAQGRPQRVEYFDTHQPGLALRLSSTGARSWVVMYRVGGKLVRETLGTVADIPTVAEARRRALASLEKARKGINSVEERRKTADEAAKNTVAAAVAAYLEDCDKKLRPGTAKEWRRIFEHDVLPAWGSRPLASITKGDVLILVNDKATRRERPRNGVTAGAAVQAGKMLLRMTTFWRWAIAQNLTEGDPTSGVRRPAKEAERDRYLAHDEIIAFWHGCEQLGWPFGPLFRLMLLTAQREGEVAGMRLSELDLEQRVWTIPAARAKNNKAHLVHLNELALEIIEQLPRRPGQDLLFSRNGKTTVSDFSVAKHKIDDLMRRALPNGELAPWVLHDLRRTTTTGLAELKIAPHVADKILNHVSGTIHGVARVYNRFEYRDERRAALEAWGRFVMTLVGGGASNVVTLRA